MNAAVDEVVVDARPVFWRIDGAAGLTRVDLDPAGWLLAWSVVLEGAFLQTLVQHLFGRDESVHRLNVAHGDFERVEADRLKPARDALGHRWHRALFQEATGAFLSGAAGEGDRKSVV